MYQSKESELNKLIQEFDLLKTKNSDYATKVADLKSKFEEMQQKVQ
jgi:predicted nuclease with TOPRIM domain